jgi:iron transport multicopper oxidase
LIATIIEAPLDLQTSISGRIPQSHYQACQDTKTPTVGNAAGNSADFLDLKGQNKSPEPLPEGFTTTGIVAFVISCLSALIGMGFIGRYGTGSLGKETSSA